MMSRMLPSPNVTFQFIKRAPNSGAARNDEAPTCHLKIVCPRYGMRSMVVVRKPECPHRSNIKSGKLSGFARKNSLDCKFTMLASHRLLCRVPVYVEDGGLSPGFVCLR